MLFGFSGFFGSGSSSGWRSLVAEIVVKPRASFTLVNGRPSLADISHGSKFRLGSTKVVNTPSPGLFLYHLATFPLPQWYPQPVTYLATAPGVKLSPTPAGR